MATVELYLMSPPAPDWFISGRANFRSQVAGPVEPLRALREWLQLAEAIEERGGRVICLIPETGWNLPGMPYAAECGQIVEKGKETLMLLPNMAAAHRQGEREHWRHLAADLGFRPVDLEGTWEAQGDVAFFRGRTLLFFGGRTSIRGLESAAKFFEPDALYLKTRQPAFHGNMALLPLPFADKLLYCPSVLEPESVEALLAAFGEEALIKLNMEEIRCYATNGLPMGEELLAPHLIPDRVIGLVQELGIRVVRLPMTELCEKAGGASRCLVSHFHLDYELVIPKTYDYRFQRNRLHAMVGEMGRTDSRFFSRYFSAHPKFRLRALGSRVNREFLDLSPLGQQVEFIDSAEHSRWIELYHASNLLAFDEDLSLPGWVLVDFYLMPAAIGLLTGPASLLSHKLREQLRLSVNDDAIIASYYAVPTLKTRTVMGCSLFSLMPQVGAAKVIKALTLRMLGAQYQLGIAQWDSPSLRVHTRMGPLEVKGPVPASHNKADSSFLYGIDLRDEASWLAHLEGKPNQEPSKEFWVDCNETKKLNQITRDPSSDKKVEIIWPGLSADGTRVRIRLRSRTNTESKDK